MSLLIILSFSIIEPKHLVSPSFSVVTHLPVYLFFATVISFLEKTERKEKKSSCLLLLLFLSLQPSNRFEQSSLLPLLKMIVKIPFHFSNFKHVHPENSIQMIFCHRV